ncbi:hypothetical protein NPIL_83411 [Nephila pilipes]|uniref:Uncharacterized protein n=1 Tax=Nephila pilipes TaxID=299642 RepID=A0A8X6NAH5_NEPPI|nr:hypothetical protein NPIL_83411 [Nephila pilipes]
MEWECCELDEPMDWEKIPQVTQKRPATKEVIPLTYYESIRRKIRTRPKVSPASDKVILKTRPLSSSS